MSNNKLKFVVILFTIILVQLLMSVFIPFHIFVVTELTFVIIILSILVIDIKTQKSWKKRKKIF